MDKITFEQVRKAQAAGEREKVSEYLVHMSLEGDPEAQCELALNYDVGEFGFKKDAAKALFWFRRSAEQGFTKGFLGLGRLLESRGRAENDYVMSQYWFARCMESDDDFVKGCCYFLGWATPKSDAIALEYFRKAAQTEPIYPEAFSWVGYLLLHGEVENDSTEAAKWFKKGGDMGKSQGKYYLANLLMNGDGVERNITASWYLYREGAHRGRATALKFLDDPIFANFYQHEFCRNACISLLCCKKYHKNSCGQLSNLPYDLVLLIGKFLWETRNDPECWECETPIYGYEYDDSALQSLYEGEEVN